MDATALIILALIVAWAGRTIYQGYAESNAPPLTFAETEHGIREPICPTCQTRLVTMTRPSHNALAGMIAWVFIIAGAFALIAVNWLAGLIAILVGVVINLSGKGSETVLACPSCQRDVRRLG